MKLSDKPLCIQRPDSKGFDELLADGVKVHFEMMDDKTLWVGLSKGNQEAHVWISAKGALTVSVNDPA